MADEITFEDLRRIITSHWPEFPMQDHYEIYVSWHAAISELLIEAGLPPARKGSTRTDALKAVELGSVDAGAVLSVFMLTLGTVK